MKRIIDYARTRGITEIWGDVLRKNRRMLEIFENLGFTQATDVDDPQLVHVHLDLER